MLKTGILNPQILSLLARVGHTNLLVIANRRFPFWPEIETVDISLVDGIPSILQVLQVILPNFDCGSNWMAQEFLDNNLTVTQALFRQAAGSIPLKFGPFVKFKLRVPQSIGVIRTGDGLQYANMIPVSEAVS